MSEASTAVATRQDLGLPFEERLAQAVVRSKLYPDITSADCALIKMQAGRELGISPMASLKAIQVIQGQPCLSAQVMQALVSASYPRYDFKPVKITAEEVQIEFYRLKELRGIASFTMADAKQAGLASKDNWRKYPVAMLYARAFSLGFRRYCGDLALTAPYTPEELGSDVIEGEVLSDVKGD